MTDRFLNIFASKTAAPRQTLPAPGIFFRYFILILSGALPYPITAQLPCMAGLLAERNAIRFPELAQERQLLRKQMAQSGIPYTSAPRTVVTIPVVVHVVFKTEQENISDEQILSQIAVLNQDFRKLNANANTVPPPFAPFAADVEFEFCLARRDPSGQPTYGITRRQTDWSNIGDLTAPDGRPRIHYAELGGTDAWEPERYLNIWIGSIGGGALGSASFPGTAPPEEDGVIVDPRYFGAIGLATFPHHLGRTATHEIGHYFNLNHIWGGDSNSCDDDDEVSDTPVQRSAYLGCPAFPQMSCGNSAMFMNFMDYTDDACMSLFTLGQKTRMWAALTTARPGLISNTVCTSTAVQETSENTAFYLYPNPAQHELWFQLVGHCSAPVQINIYDVSGKIWATQKTLDNTASIRVDISAMPNGFYLATLTNGTIYAVRPFVRSF
ncbi:MAG: T9SS type A sorting domain-containing protein [Thermoanaerobaculia bacterium]|nr:T9SS type A sorting domain-containing protein [Thermoanaerobaculia bacterium]